MIFWELQDIKTEVIGNSVVGRKYIMHNTTEKKYEEEKWHQKMMSVGKIETKSHHEAAIYAKYEPNELIINLIYNK